MIRVRQQNCSTRLYMVPNLWCKLNKKGALLRLRLIEIIICEKMIIFIAKGCYLPFFLFTSIIFESYSCNFVSCIIIASCCVKNFYERKSVLRAWCSRLKLSLRWSYSNIVESLCRNCSQLQLTNRRL